MEHFWAHGYEGTGVTALLEHMGIQRQSMYNTFGSKEDVLFESLDLYATNLHKMLREAMRGAATPFEKIDRLFDFWRQTGASGCFIGNCVAEFGQTHDRVAEVVGGKLESIRGIFRDIFQEAIERGDLPAERDPDVLAHTLLTYSQGLALMGKSNTDRDQMNSTIETMKRSLKS